MVKPEPRKDDAVIPAAPRAKRPPIDKTARKVANLLKEVGVCYRDAGSALMRGHEVEYATSLELANTYLALIAKLSEKSADIITAEGFAGIAES